MERTAARVVVVLVPVLVVGGTALALLGGPVASVVVYSGSYDPTPVGEPASPFALVLSAQQTTGAGLVVLGLLLAALLVGRRWGARSAR